MTGGHRRGGETDRVKTLYKQQDKRNTGAGQASHPSRHAWRSLTFSEAWRRSGRTGGASARARRSSAHLRGVFPRDNGGAASGGTAAC